MNAHKILFPTDFSINERHALEMASALARAQGAKLLIVHVEEPPVAYGGEFYYGMEGPNIAELHHMLAAVVPTDPEVAFEHRMLKGAPGRTIVELTEKEPDIDLIVMSTHGRTGLARLLMGSVAEKVVREAKCPVLTVKTANHVMTNVGS